MGKSFHILLVLSLVAPGCDPRTWVVGDPPTGGVVGTGGAGAGGAGGNAPPTGSHAVADCAGGTPPIPVRPLDRGLARPELARRMARLFWAGDPDAQTLLRADAARTNADVAEMASTMMADARYSLGLTAFFTRWLELEEIQNGSYVDETLLFALDVVLAGDARLETLLTAPHSFVNDDNAAIYGLPGPGAGFRKMMLDARQRAGVFTQPSFLTASERGPGRGSRLGRALLCRDIPPPPPGVDIPALTPTSPSGLTTRQRIESLVTAPPCVACHVHIDPPGFAFETFDAQGRFRTTEGDTPVDTSGTIELDFNKVTFASFREMLPALASSCDVRSCLVEQMLRHAAAVATLRPPIDGDASWEITATFGSFGYDLRRLMLAVATSRRFLAP